MRHAVIISIIFSLAITAQVSLVLGQGVLAITVYATAGKSNEITFTGKVTQGGGPVANATVVYEIRSANNSLTGSGFAVTNATGAYSRSMVVPSSSTPGPYTIYVGVSNDGESASNSTSFQPVPEFPAFAIPLLFLLSICMVTVRLRHRQRKL